MSKGYVKEGCRRLPADIPEDLHWDLKSLSSALRSPNLSITTTLILAHFGKKNLVEALAPLCSPEEAVEYAARFITYMEDSLDE